MSCGGMHETPCNEVLNSVGLLIDGEIHEVSQIQSIEIHFEECSPCREEMEHERRMHQLLHEVLTRSCHESAPQELKDELAYQLAVLKQGPQDFVAEYRRTEISIQMDGFGNVEHHEITVETNWIHERHDLASPEDSSEG
jgi:mycothiol system anti-sigma-R factor